MPNAMIVLDHRDGQAVWGIQTLIGKPVTIADPALIDGFLLERYDSHHPIVLDLNVQGRTK